jgi:hypothetical protein
MRVFEPKSMAETNDAAAYDRIVTTLYDLIESLHTQVTSGEDELVIAAMKHLINTRRLTFLALRHAHRLQCA